MLGVLPIHTTVREADVAIKFYPTALVSQDL